MPKKLITVLLRGWLVGVVLLWCTTLATAQELKFSNLGDFKLLDGETLKY
jgi:hypothetical protein